MSEPSPPPTPRSCPRSTGSGPHTAFTPSCFGDTSRSETTLLNVFDQSAGGNALALHFRYVWALASETVVDFECVDVFELAEDRTRFTRMTIIYDTARLGDDFEAPRENA